MSEHEPEAGVAEALALAARSEGQGTVEAYEALSRRVKALEVGDAAKAQVTAENIAYALDRIVVALENIAVEIAVKEKR
jgi:hypothetical protein